MVTLTDTFEVSAALEDGTTDTHTLRALSLNRRIAATPI